MINRKVIDISHWNKVTDWNAVKAAGVIGVIAKATESTNYKDIDYATNHANALAHGLLFGAYHFLHPGNIAAQVDYFLNTTGVDNLMLYAMDWEDTSSGTASAADAQQFLTLLETEIGDKRGVVYSGNAAKEKISGKNAFFGARRLWLAQYGPTPVVQASWLNYWLWQYSDGVHGPTPHGCPGVAGDVDTSSWPGSDNQLQVQWSGAPSAVVPPAPAPVPSISITTTGSVKIIVNGTEIT